MTNSRNLSTPHLLLSLIRVQLRMNLTARKTRALAIVQLLPVLAALVYVIFESADGLSMFMGITESVTLPFLVPLAAIFFGGPAIVEEVEGRTLTYLTLRPIPKTAIMLGKVIAGATVACVLTLLPVIGLFIICATQADIAEIAPTFGKAAAAVVLGTIAYTTIFAALGAIFASSLLASIIYFVLFEMVFATLPVLELLSIRYYMRTLGGFQATDRMGMLDKLILQEPIVFEWWVGAIVLTAVAIIGIAGGAITFRERQYHV